MYVWLFVSLKSGNAAAGARPTDTAARARKAAIHKASAGGGAATGGSNPPNETRKSTTKNNERTGHDGALGEVAVEELVVDRDVLVPDRVLSVLELDDAVDEQEGVAWSVLVCWCVQCAGGWRARRQQRGGAAARARVCTGMAQRPGGLSLRSIQMHAAPNALEKRAPKQAAATITIARAWLCCFLLQAPARRHYPTIQSDSQQRTLRSAHSSIAIAARGTHAETKKRPRTGAAARP